MRLAACASVLGLFLLGGAFGQTAPPCPQSNRTALYFSQRNAPSRTLQTKLPATSSLRQDGTNRSVIDRAIRALASRVFPGRKPAQAQPGAQSSMGLAVNDRSYRGTGFRFVMGARQPCAEVAPVVRGYR